MNKDTKEFFVHVLFKYEKENINYNNLSKMYLHEKENVDKYHRHISKKKILKYENSKYKTSGPKSKITY